MKWVTEVDKSDLIKEIAVELKKIDELVPPEWSMFVRTGNDKQKPPIEKDWWYMRAASIMIKVVYLGPVGVAKLRTKFGGKKRRGHKPAEFRKASGSIIRTILQQLEKAGLIKQQDKGVHKGKVLTPKGMSLINTIAKTQFKKKPKKTVAAKPKDAEKPVEKAKVSKEVPAKADDTTKKPSGKPLTEKKPAKEKAIEEKTSEKKPKEDKAKPVEEKSVEAVKKEPVEDEPKEEKAKSVKKKPADEMPAEEAKTEKVVEEKPEEKSKTESPVNSETDESKPKEE